MKPKIYTIKDFDFKPHVVIEGAVQGLLKLPNGITVSIVGGGLQSIVGGMNRLRGDGVDTFEVAAWRANGGLISDWIKLDGDNEILEYVDKNKLPFILLDLSKK
jgi:hypothetical protein